MRQMKNYQYYVEGEDEEKLIRVLKTDMELIIPGKVQRFNVIEQKFTQARLMTLKPNTTVVLVFDTDTKNDKILKENLSILQKCSMVTVDICVMQVSNLEDELIRSCNIKKIKELTGSQTDKEFKRDFITASNLKQKLERHGFEFGKLWCRSSIDGFKGIKNEADKIRKKKE